MMRLRRLDDHVRHWRRLAAEPGSERLRESLAALDAVRRDGFALERALRQDAADGRR
jgi:hypothetical protein